MTEIVQDALLSDLSEGIVLVENGRVHYLNQAAADLLAVSCAQSVGLPLIAVLRDHRLERAYVERKTVECKTRGRIILARPISRGLALKDVTAQKEAEELSRELLAVLSHELRTPVSIIRATLEALRGEIPDDLRAKFLERAEAESTRLVRLLEDLTADVKPPQYRSIDVPDVVTRALGLMFDIFQRHNIQFEQRLDVLSVWADEDKFLQVLINLLENAAIHGPDGEVVTLQSFVYSEDPNYAAIVVRDLGRPLPDEGVSELFKFHSRGQSTKTKGTGLGLYIVKNIAESWGGKAWAKPLESGNEFGISVRIKAVQPSQRV